MIHKHFCLALMKCPHRSSNASAYQHNTKTAYRVTHLWHDQIFFFRKRCIIPFWAVSKSVLVRPNMKNDRSELCRYWEQTCLQFLNHMLIFVECNMQMCSTSWIRLFRKGQLYPCSICCINELWSTVGLIWNMH